MENRLYHYGIKGMKWGVRRTPEQLGHARKRVEKIDKTSIIKTENDLAKQKSSSLRKGIRSLTKQIEEHEEKIRDPENHYEGWDSLSKGKQAGVVKHWKKEIAVFKESVNYRIYELKKRGETK